MKAENTNYEIVC